MMELWIASGNRKELKKEQAIVEIYRKSYILADLMKQSVYDNNHNLNITDIDITVNCRIIC